MNRTIYDWPQAERAAREALGLHADTAAMARARLTPIPGSLSNFAWHAVTGTEENFVRLARPGSEKLGASLDAEAQILHQVAAAGLAPAVVRCDPGARLLVTRWIDARSDVPGIIAPLSLEQVGEAMARLHALHVPAHLRHVRFGEQARLLEAALPASTLRADFTAVAAEVFARLDTERTLVLCHHDIHSQNIIIDAGHRLWLVDWEYAGLGDPDLRPGLVHVPGRPVADGRPRALQRIPPGWRGCRAGPACARVLGLRLRAMALVPEPAWHGRRRPGAGRSGASVRPDRIAVAGACIRGLALQ